MDELETVVVNRERDNMLVLVYPGRLLDLSEDLSGGRAANQIVKFIPVCFRQVRVVKAINKNIVNLP
jgi:hypothetical protein